MQSEHIRLLIFMGQLFRVNYLIPSRKQFKSPTILDLCLTLYAPIYDILGPRWPLADSTLQWLQAHCPPASSWSEVYCWSLWSASQNPNSMTLTLFIPLVLPNSQVTCRWVKTAAFLPLGQAQLKDQGESSLFLCHILCLYLFPILLAIFIICLALPHAGKIENDF